MTIPDERLRELYFNSNAYTDGIHFQMFVEDFRTNERLCTGEILDIICHLWGSITAYATGIQVDEIEDSETCQEYLLMVNLLKVVILL